MLEPEVASLGQERWGALEPEDVLEDSVTNDVAAPALPPRLIVKRYLEHNQPVVPGDRGSWAPLGY